MPPQQSLHIGHSLDQRAFNALAVEGGEAGPLREAVQLSGECFLGRLFLA
jgi:hypothetical protein